MNLFVIGVTLILFLTLFAFYGNFEVSVKMANKITALMALGLIALTLVLGPLSKFQPSIFQKYKQHRKWLGIVGFLFAFVHILITLADYYKYDIFRIIAPTGPKLWGVYAGLAAFIIFLAMALTSNKESVKRLTYHKWKMLQMLGYAGIALVLVHFFIVETKEGVFTVRPLGYALFIFGILTLLARIAVWLMGLPARKKFEEHVS